MAVFLRNITIKGIKNICEPAELIFCKKEVKNVKEFTDCNIKAIYGPNGSGKTALVHAFQILRGFITESGYLFNSEKKKYLSEIVNKSCKSIELKADFFHIDEAKNIVIYSYEVEILNKNDNFEIAQERFSLKTSEYNKEKIIIETKSGVFSTYNLPDILNTHFTNLLNKRSFADILFDLIRKNEDELSEASNTGLSEAFGLVKPLFELVYNMKVILDSKDEHTKLFPTTNEKLEEMIKWRKENQALISMMAQLGYKSRIMSQNELDKYKVEVEKKTHFIKLFKPNIKKIDLVYKMAMSSADNKVYSVNEFIDYGDYSIDLELESVGIKKLMNLYNSIKFLSNGGILIIDELDSHINDIYLVKLVEYVSNYANGQLIFTTHNVSPMEMLKSKKNSIDFMSMSGKVASWKQIGNYSPSKLYKKGMINGLPFNLDSEDFLGVFNNE